MLETKSAAALKEALMATLKGIFIVTLEGLKEPT